jgi:hypothetical protein
MKYMLNNETHLNKYHIFYHTLHNLLKSHYHNSRDHKDIMLLNCLYLTLYKLNIQNYLHKLNTGLNKVYNLEKNLGHKNHLHKDNLSHFKLYLHYISNKAGQ